MVDTSERQPFEPSVGLLDEDTLLGLALMGFEEPGDDECQTLVEAAKAKVQITSPEDAEAIALSVKEFVDKDPPYKDEPNQGEALARGALKELGLQAIANGNRKTLDSIIAHLRSTKVDQDRIAADSLVARLNGIEETDDGKDESTEHRRFQRAKKIGKTALKLF